MRLWSYHCKLADPWIANWTLSSECQLWALWMTCFPVKKNARPPLRVAWGDDRRARATRNFDGAVSSSYSAVAYSCFANNYTFRWWKLIASKVPAPSRLAPPTTKKLKLIARGPGFFATVSCKNAKKECRSQQITILSKKVYFDRLQNLNDLSK